MSHSHTICGHLLELDLGKITYDIGQHISRRVADFIQQLLSNRPSINQATRVCRLVYIRRAVFPDFRDRVANFVQ